MYVAAVEAGNWQLAAEMFEAGANPSAKWRGRTASHEAIQKPGGERLKAIEFVLKCAADPNIADDWTGETPLAILSRAGTWHSPQAHDDTMSMLLAYGADPDTPVVVDRRLPLFRDPPCEKPPGTARELLERSGFERTKAMLHAVVAQRAACEAIAAVRRPGAGWP